jgi:hypothetical protein
MYLTPKEFELLLCEFSKQDLPKNFTVEHDIKDIGGESENQRQIDTKIKGKLGVSDILICGEAKNWNKPVGSETIDGLVGKYLSGEIRANKVIVYSNQGYTAPAIKRAKQIGIELIEPKELGVPIKNIPFIIGVGYLGQMIITATHKSPQQNLMAINPNDYVILKGDERISFQQNVFRLIRLKLRKIEDKSIYNNYSEFELTDNNVLYELKQKSGYKYNADFEIKVSMKWIYFFEFLPSGILHHLNTNEDKFVNLQNNDETHLQNVLMSPTKQDFEDREECIKEVVEINFGYTFNMCLVDPDRNKTHPQEPIFSLV